MSKSAYQVAREALSVLEFYSDSYGSSPVFQDERRRVAAELKTKAQEYPDGSGGKELLLDLAALFGK
jgi:hypothetical protein